MINYGKHTIHQDDIDEVVKILNSDWLTQGAAVGEFESKLCEYFGAKHCSVVQSGTAGLHLTGKALKWQKSDIVITTPLTFLATANSILYSNATPDFIDINQKTYTIDPNLLEKKIKSYLKLGKRVKSVIGVDYAGHPCDWESLREIADMYDFTLINDNCHALGASYRNNKQYAVKYADIVIQSYHPVKNFTTGEGGSVLTNDKELHKKIELLRSHGISKQENEITNYEGPWYYEMKELGYNYRITDFQCALGSSQLKRLDTFINKRYRIAAKYSNLFTNINKYINPEVCKNVKHAYHIYPLQIKFDDLSISKIDLFKYMKYNKINLQVHYIPIHLQSYYQKKFGFRIGDFPIAERFYRNEVSLPIYPDLEDNQLDYVYNTLNEYIK